MFQRNKIILEQKHIDRFWSCVDKNGKQTEYVDSPCWEWTRKLGPRGYGRLRVGEHTFKAHCVSYVISENQQIPEGKIINHKCHNPSCVRPDHLYAGTFQDNNRDTVKAGRRNYPIENGRDKLNNVKVAAIKEMIIYEIPNRGIAEFFGVSIENISLIRHNKVWEQVPWPVSDYDPEKWKTNWYNFENRDRVLLTERDVFEIYWSPISAEILAEKYNIRRENIYSIRNNKIWSYVPKDKEEFEKFIHGIDKKKEKKLELFEKYAHLKPVEKEKKDPFEEYMRELSWGPQQEKSSEGKSVILDVRELKKFWSKVDYDGKLMPEMDSCCWEWTGWTNKSGYGGFNVVKNKHGLRSTAIGAHQISQMNFNGPVPEGYHVCHKCDNPACVRPSHLYAGTVKENANDKKLRDRYNSPKGENHGYAKLKETDIPLIFKMRAEGKGMDEIAKNFNVVRSMIGFILRRKNWTHVEIDTDILSEVEKMYRNRKSIHETHFSGSIFEDE